MKTYEVVAKKWRRGWELHIAGVGVTQSRNLAGAEEMARDYIALDLDVPGDSFDVRITPEVGNGVDEKVRRTQAQINAATTVVPNEDRAEHRPPSAWDTGPRPPD